MYDYISGKLVSYDANGIVLDNAGIGYYINASTLSIDKFANSVHPLIKVYTYLQVREDGVALFGFVDTEERDIFTKLITVSGVGPKIALQIMSGIQPADLILAIITGDIKSFAKVKGIGKKTAERIILELREKITMSDATQINVSNNSSAGEHSQIKSEAVEALVQFGFSRPESMKAVSEVLSQDDTLETLIAKALKVIR